VDPAAGEYLLPFEDDGDPNGISFAFELYSGKLPGVHHHGWLFCNQAFRVALFM
jgi:hypothetical protein